METTTSGADTAPRALALGQFDVMALHDGHFDLPTGFLQRPDGAQAMDGETFHLDVNCFLLQTGARNILVDTGAGAQLGPTVNKLRASLAAVGLTPADIDAVLCTHIHPDHTNGLIDADKTPLFANAQIFVHQREVDFWLSEDARTAAPETMRALYDWALEAFAPYAGRIEPFTGGEILPGIEALALPGHTPGHSGFHVDGGGKQQLVIWGDAVHQVDVQTRDPAVSVQADVDQAGARTSRLSLFDRVSVDGALVTGMHVRFPGFGRLERERTGYSYHTVQG